MSSQFFAKFQYQDKIKKIGLFTSDLTWDYITNVISRSFSISPSRIRLTYKDPEGDEITACCDQDLVEAYRASPNQQMLRFFIYKANLNTQNSLPVNESTSKKSLQLSSSTAKSPKSKSLSSIKDSSDDSEKKESIIISQKSQEQLPQKPVIKLNTQEVKDLLKTLFQTSEAQKAINQLKLTHNVGSSGACIIDFMDSKDLLEQILSESLTTAFNEPTSFQQNIVKENVPEVVNPTEIDFKNTIISQGSFEEEEKEGPAKHKLDFEKSLLNSTLKETIYERSQGDMMMRRTLDKNQVSMRTKSLSNSVCCKDLTSSYGVKLALQYENGKMRLVSIPSGEYTIIDSIGASSKNKGENANVASQIKKSFTMDVLPRLT